MARRRFTAGQNQVLAIDPRAAEQDYDEGRDASQELTGKIAVVCIEGPIEQRAGWFGPGYDSIRACFQLALDSDASAVVLKINSPGGAAAGNVECARAMIEAKKKSGKPVWAYSDESAYSAAYALACVADEIYLPDTGGVGSIGCLCVAADMTEMAKMAGIKAVVVRSGSRKAEGHPLLPLDDASLASFQSRVDDLAKIFAEFVAESRTVSPKKLLSLEGACFYGEDAIKKGLADGVCSFDSMIGRLAAQVVPLDTVAQVGPFLNNAGESMNLEQLRAALAAAQAAGDIAKVASIQAQIATVTAEEEDSEDEGSEEESDDGGDDEGDDEDDPKEEEEETKKTTTVKTYRRSKKSAAAIASAVEEVFPGLSAAQVTGKLMALRDGQSSKRTLEAKVKQLETENRAAQVSKLVARGVRQGKITPAQKDFWTKQGMRADGVESLKEYLDTASPVVSTETLTPSLETPVSPGGLTVLETTIATRMGVTPEQFSKQKALGTTVVLSRVG